MNTFIKITYSLNDEQIQLSIDLSNTLENLINHIGNSHKIQPNDIEIFYNDKKLTPQEYQKRIHDIVGDKKQPYFYVKTKDETKAAIHHVVIEHFPSRAELYEQLQIFLNENGFNKNFNEDHKDNWVKFSFYEQVFIRLTFRNQLLSM
jgi:hypothetical protein